MPTVPTAARADPQRVEVRVRHMRHRKLQEALLAAKMAELQLQQAQWRARDELEAALQRVLRAGLRRLPPDTEPGEETVIEGGYRMTLRIERRNRA